MMPVMDGLEFTPQLKQNMATSHIPVILLTARSLAEQREEGYDTGANSYLTKPFSGSVLLARVDNLLRSRTMLRSLFSGDKKEEAVEEQLGSHAYNSTKSESHDRSDSGRLTKKGAP